MPVQKVHFSVPPINEASTQLNANALSGGFAANKGTQTIKFALSAQDRLLDTSDMYLSFQIVYVDSNGTPIKIPAGPTAKADYSTGNGTGLTKLANLNIGNWSGVQNAIRRVTVQSKKSSVELSNHRNYPMYVSARNAHVFSNEEYIESPLTRYGAGGDRAGDLNRHTVTMSNATNASGGDFTNISNINDEQYGQFCSFRIDTALLNNSMPLHLGNDYLGGILVNLELNNNNGFFYQRFQDIGTNQVNAGVTGSYYILKNMRLQGRLSVPTPDELKAYQPQMILADRNSLRNDVQSSVNSMKYTPNTAMTKSFVNLFLDNDQKNDIQQNQSNFRVPLGIRSYQQNKNNTRSPQDFVIECVPNLQDKNSAAPNNAITFSAANVTPKIAAQGDAEIRANFQRSLLDGRLADKCSTSLSVSNASLTSDYELTRASGGQSQNNGVLNNVNADAQGIGLDYTNAMGNASNFVQRDYDLVIRSGVASGNTDLPESRRSKPEAAETYVRNSSAFNTQTLQKSFS
jgi:hypothetical protein